MAGDKDDGGLFGPVISQYTRAQAIEDGSLVDVSNLARPVGFRFPVALTRALWAKIDPDDGQPGDVSADTIGRARDLLAALRWAVKRAPDGDRVSFPFLTTAGPVPVWCVIGPGDTAAPVFTVMLQGED